MNNFIFSPADGLMDKTYYTTNPSTEEEARGQIQDPLNQLKDFINTDVKKAINGDILLSRNGYKVEDSGLIEQWGEVLNVASTSTMVTFPKAFPNDCFICIASTRTAQAGSFANTLNVTKTGFQIATDRAGVSVYWFAKGR